MNNVLKILWSAAIVASQLQGFHSEYFQSMGKRFSWVGCDAVGEGAPHDVGDLGAKVNGQLLSDTVRTDDGDMSFRGDQCEPVEFVLGQLSIFNFDDVLGSLFL